MADTVKLSEVPDDQIPAQFKVGYYFDFDAQPFAHAALLQNSRTVIDAIAGISDYATAWIAEKLAAATKATVKTEQDYPGRCYGKFRILIEDGAYFEPGFIYAGDREGTMFIGKGSHVYGVNVWLDSGDIYVGEDNVIEPAVGIKGATIIGNKNEIRQGVYFRGDCIVGDECTLRGELKNAVVMNKGNFPHPGYLGDSLCGYNTHFGGGAESANLGILAVVSRDNIVLEIDGKKYDTGRPKIGIIMGDNAQCGCNSVTDPGTFLAPWTITYQLCRISKGFYGPRELLKNKPLEHGIIERTPLKM